MAIDATDLKHIHFVGIKGVAMTALAVYCKEKGIQVSGSDIEEEFPTKESLMRAGITPLSGFSKDHILSSDLIDLVVFTGAHGGKDNIEVTTAREVGIETMPHGRALGFFMNGSTQVSVAGSHGKTTTTALIASILVAGGLDPSYAVGCGEIRDLGLPGHFGNGRIFVAEADEYVTDPTHDTTPRFLWQHPDILVVTNIDYDHPDAYADLKAVQEAFVRLQKQQNKGSVTIINADDPNSTLLLKNSTNKIVTYGISRDANYHPEHIRMEEGKTTFTCMFNKKDIGSFSLFIPGVFNVMNACAAIAAGHTLKVSWDDIRRGLETFRGTKRRFELVGTIGTVYVYDDYAHHPYEIRETLRGVRDWYPKQRIITIFQPHTFSRTKTLLSDFAGSFKTSDIVCISDIYASAREKKDSEINAVMLVDEIKKQQKNVFYVKNAEGTISYLKNNLKRGDIIICMGAGDIYGWGRKIITMIQSDQSDQSNQTDQSDLSDQ